MHIAYIYGSRDARRSDYFLETRSRLTSWSSREKDRRQVANWNILGQDTSTRSDYEASEWRWRAKACNLKTRARLIDEGIR